MTLWPESKPACIPSRVVPIKIYGTSNCEYNDHVNCMYVVGEFSLARVLVANEVVVRFSSVFLHAFAIVIRGANIYVSCFEVKSGIHHVCGGPVLVFMHVGGCMSNIRDQTS